MEASQTGGRAMIRRSAFYIAAALALTVPAAAQQIVIQPRAATAPEAKSDIRVTIGMNFLRSGARGRRPGDE